MNADERAEIISREKEDTGRTHRLWCKGEFRDFQVWRVPVEGLLLNIDNRRHKAERQLMEEDLCRSLDVEARREDEASLISILLDKSLEVEGDRVHGKPSGDTQALKEDWLKRKQETPIWIRPDGPVRNGNRRLALVKRLHGELGRDAYTMLDAIILEPEEISDHDLFQMEQREQLTENLKVRYTDINLLLTLRERAIQEGIDWGDPNSIDRVGGFIQHLTDGSKTYATKQLWAIRAMDDFLEDTGKPGQYHELFGMVERFREVGRLVAMAQEEFPEEAADMIRVAFAAVRAGNPHGDLRMLRRIFLQDRERYDQLVREIEDLEKGWVQADRHELPKPELPEAEEAENGGEDRQGPAAPDYPAERVGSRIRLTIDGWEASNDTDVEEVLEEIVNRLEALSWAQLRAAMTIEGPAARESLQTILAWCDEAKAELEV